MRNLNIAKVEHEIAILGKNNPNSRIRYEGIYTLNDGDLNEQGRLIEGGLITKAKGIIITLTIILIIFILHKFDQGGPY